MKSTPFPDCCGVKILSQFGNTFTAIDTSSYKEEEIRDFLKEQARNEVFGWSEHNAFQIVTLNNEQFDKISYIFIEEGFEVIAKNPHIKHNSIIYILLKTLKYGKESKKIQAY